MTTKISSTDNRKTHILNAEGQILGRLAVQISALLRGKHKTDFAPHKDGGDFVVVENVDKMIVSGKKIKQKIYHHFTGFLGGMKELTMEQVINKKGKKEILKRAVAGMLPANKLKPKMMKRLIIK